MTSPSGSEADLFLVLVNDRNQHSLWPASVQEIPAGWSVVHAQATRQECLDYVETNWTDLRPAGVVKSRPRSPSGG